ncbi:hypothetical protein [Corallococcus exercitus]|uniref:hypothetical protein n=1 Tax=Corallococcus exercitus TaxID=2316736 RepID=UPI0035D513DD
MAMNEDAEKKVDLNAKEEELRQRKADSGDESGQGRPRRDDNDVYPRNRGPENYGTHGGQKEPGANAPERTGPKEESGR